jgi:gamma-glutamylcysteine synthetase
MSQYVAESAPAPAVEHYDQLVEYFEQGCKPPRDWRIGTEYERVVVDAP